METVETEINKEVERKGVIGKQERNGGWMKIKERKEEIKESENRKVME